MLTTVETAILELEWPVLPLAKWKNTRDTLHMWTQVVGKIRMELSPPVNHWWHTTLFVSPRGLTTSAIPYKRGYFQIDFDFAHHNLLIQTSEGTSKMLPLIPKAVADFYQEVMVSLKALGIDVKIWAMPVEVPDPIPFDKDYQHAFYDPEYVGRFWRVLMLIDSILREFRSRFTGKCSPVHFFWGSFDLAVTRFSGRKAPERAGADGITREAYSHEVISVGWWPGGGAIEDAAFYSYTAPAPPGLENQKVLPETAIYKPEAAEFLLPYEDVRKSASPRQALLDFAQSTYEAGANLGKWDRASLER